MLTQSFRHYTDDELLNVIEHMQLPAAKNELVRRVIAGEWRMTEHERETAIIEEERDEALARVDGLYETIDELKQKLSGVTA